MRAIRSQADTKGDHYTQMTGLYCPPEEDMTRQEFKNDADINILLRRFGVNTPQRPGATFGEVDYDLDLHTAMQATLQLHHAWSKAPADVRERYPSPNDLFHATQTGELKTFLQERAAIADRAAKVKAETDLEAEIDHEDKKAHRRAKKAHDESFGKPKPDTKA